MGWSSIKKWFKGAAKWVGDKAKSVGKWGKQAAKDVWGVTKNVTNTLYNDAKSVVKWEAKQGEKIIGSATGFVDNVGKVSCKTVFPLISLF